MNPTRTINVRLPDGDSIQIPYDISREDLRELLFDLSEKYPEIGEAFYPTQRTTLGQAAAFVPGLAKGVVGTGITMGQGLAALLTPGRDTGIERGLGSLQERVSRVGSPVYRDSMGEKLGAGLGSLGGFVAAGALGTLAGAPAAAAALPAALLSGAGEQAQRIEMSRARGQEVSTGQELAALGFGTVIGATEVLPVGRILDKTKLTTIAHARAASLLAKIPKKVQNVPAAYRAMTSAMGTAAMEGGQEVMAAKLQELTQRGIYDPTLPPSESLLDEFLVGGFAGGVMDMAVTAMAGGAGRRFYAQRYLAEEDARNADVGMKVRAQALLADARSRAAEASRGLEESQGDLGIAGVPGRTLIKDYRIGENEKGELVIEDSAGNPVDGLPPFMNTDEATKALSDLQAHEANVATLAAGLLKLDAQGLRYSPEAAEMAWRITSPETVTFPAVAVAQYAPDVIGAIPGPDPYGGNRSAYAQWLKKNPALAGKSRLTATEVISAVGRENASRLFLDRAMVGAREYVRAQRARADQTGLPIMNTAEESQAWLDEAEEAFGNRPDLENLGERRVSNQRLRHILEEKNLKVRGGVKGEITDPAFKFFLKQVAGEESWSDMTSGQKALVLSTLAQMPTMPSELALSRYGNKVPFPDLSAPLYTPGQFRAAVAMAAANRGKATLSQVAKDLTVTREAADQILDHMDRSGRGIREGDGIHGVKEERLFDAERRAAEPDAEAKADELIDLVDADDGTVRRFYRNQFKIIDRDNGADYSTQATPSEKADAVVGTRKAADEFIERVKRIVARMNFAGVIDVASDEEASFMAQQMAERLAGGKDNVRLGSFSPLEFKIALYTSAVDPDGEMNADQLYRALQSTVYHEIMHGAREGDYFTQAEWEALERASRKAVVPESVDPNAASKEMSWVDAVKARNPNLSDVDAVTEAVSDMFSAYMTDRIPKRFKGGLMKNVLGRLTDYTRGVVGASRDSGMNQALAVMAGVKSGRVGLRGVGRSVVEPEGPVRSLKSTAEGITPERAAKAIEGMRNAITRGGRVPGEAPEFGAPRAASRATLRSMGFNLDMPLYHGTSHAFTDFRVGGWGDIWFTTDPAEASEYFGGAGEARARNPRRNIRPVYAKMANPWRGSLSEYNAIGGRELARRGHDAAVLDMGDATHVAVFDPANVMTTFEADALFPDAQAPVYGGAPSQGELFPSIDRAAGIATQAQQLAPSLAQAQVRALEGDAAPEDLHHMTRTAMEAKGLIDEAGNFTELGDAVRGLFGFGPEAVINKARADEVKAARDAELAAAVPGGIAPAVGVNASPLALDAYYRTLTSGISEEIDPALRIKFSERTKTSPELERMIEGVTGEYVDSGRRTWGERLLTYMDHPSKWEQFKDWAREKGLTGREWYLDKNVRLRGLSHRERQLIGDMLADASLEGAATFMDMKQHFMQNVLTRGALRYALDLETDPETQDISEIVSATSPDKGFFIVDNNTTTKDGTRVKGLLHIMSMLTAPDGSDRSHIFDAYLLAKRAIRHIDNAAKAKGELESNPGLEAEEIARLERIVAQGKKVVGGKSKQELQELVARIAEEQPDVLEFESMFRAMNGRLIEFARDTGIVPEEQAAEWLDNDVYVPEYVAEDGHYSRNWMRWWKRKEGAGKKTVLEREREGSEREINIPLMERVLMNHDKIISDGLRNVRDFRAARALLRTGEGEALVEKKNQKDGPGVIRYYEKGQERWVQAYDPKLAASLMAGGAELAGDFDKLAFGTSRALYWPTRALRELITRSPNFMIRQLLRDPVAIHHTAGLGDDAGPWGRWLDSVRNMTANTLEQMEIRGIALDRDYNSDPAEYQRVLKRMLTNEGYTSATGDNVASSALKRMWDVAGRVSKLTDAAPRFQVYKEILEQTGNHGEAIYQAVEVLNFGRRGSSPGFRLLTSLVPFMNARLQGLDVFYRAATGQYTANPELVDPGAVRARFALRGAYVATLAALYWMSQKDKEDWQNLRDEVREDYWVWPISGDLAVRVPVAFEPGYLFKSVPESILNYLSDRDEKELLSSWARMAHRNLSFDLPQFMAPLVGAVRNHNNYTGTNIVPYYMAEGVEARDQYTPETNRMAVVAGQLTGMSPMKLEYLLSNYFGGLGLYAMMAGDSMARRALGEGSSAGTRWDIMDPTRAPVVSAFVGAGRGGFQQEFYELRDEIDSLVGSLNKLKEDGKLDEFRVRRQAKADLLSVKGAVRSMERFMDNWRDRRDRVLREPMDGDTRKRLLEELEAQRDARLATVPLLRRKAEGRR